MHNHRQLTCILIAILESIIVLSPVYAQTACHLAAVQSNYPDMVPAGQHFQVSTTLTVTCSGGYDPFNDIRVDLIDAHAQNQPAILSSNKYTYSVLNAQSVTTTIVNDVIAPSETGTWVLRLDTYVIGRPSGSALASNQQLFNVQVVPYTPTTATSMITTTTSLTTTPITSTTSQQVALPTSTVTSTSTLREFAKQDNLPYYAAIFILLIALIVIMILLRQKKSMKEKTRVWDTNPQGSSAA
jgi:hypothetical protein